MTFTEFETKVQDAWYSLVPESKCCVESNAYGNADIVTIRIRFIIFGEDFHIAASIDINRDDRDIEYMIHRLYSDYCRFRAEKILG